MSGRILQMDVGDSMALVAGHFHSHICSAAGIAMQDVSDIFGSLFSLVNPWTPGQLIINTIVHMEGPCCTAARPLTSATRMAAHLKVQAKKDLLGTCVPTVVDAFWHMHHWQRRTL